MPTTVTRDVSECGAVYDTSADLASAEKASITVASTDKASTLDRDREDQSRTTANDELTVEVLLRSRTRESGHTAHEGEGDGVGVIEKRAVVDLGNGPEEVVVVEWHEGDPEHPFNWSRGRKVAITVAVVYNTALTAFNAAAIGAMAQWGQPWFGGISHTLWELNLFIYLLAIAVTPLVLAPMSELFGRNVIYHVTSIINTLLFLPQIFSHNFGGVIATRWFQGMTSSVGNSMVGGTIADIFPASERGVAMNVMSLGIFLGQSLGGVVCGWVGYKLGYQWCYGIQALMAVLSVLLQFATLKETRADVLLSRRARRLTQRTGIKHICPTDLQKKSLATMLKVSAIRPLQYLFTEPIVSAIATWIGFAWACIFLCTSSTLIVFRQWGGNPGVTSTALLCILVGGLLGFVSNYHQEYIYRRAARRSPTGRAAPEVRLYWAATGGLLFPLGTFAYAWTGRPQFPWIVPAIFLSLSMWGEYIMYSSVFNYFADTYETYSSSAQAAQSFVRNFASAIMPLFSTQLYGNLGYPQASTLVASIATVLGIAPAALIVFGPRLRARSRAASALAQNN